MKVLFLCRKLLKNKIVLYMSSRYLTYILTFVVNMYIALLLGPEQFGIWSFLLLVFWYFNIIDLGVPNAVQVLIVQEKSNPKTKANIEKTGNALILALSSFSFLVALYYHFGGISKAHELNLSWMFYAICICAFFNYFCNLYDKIYRCKNRLFELAYKQTSVVFFMALAVLLVDKTYLLEALVFSYLIWTLSSFCLFCFRGALDFTGLFSKAWACRILNKGFYLFLFSSGFSLLIITTKSIISAYYSLEDFGLFSFAYYLGHAVYNCLLAFSSIIITKLIDRFHSPDKKIVISTITIVRENYVKLFHGAIYFAMIAFPIILFFMPQYSETLSCMNLCALMMLCYANSFGYSTYLMAVNKEKKLALISVASLVINLMLGLFIASFHVTYDIVVFSTMISYFNYAVMCTYFGRKELNESIEFQKVLIDCFPVELFVPFVVAIFISILNVRWLVAIPLLLFVFMNKKSITSIIITIRKLIYNPNIIDI